MKKIIFIVLTCMIGIQAQNRKPYIISLQDNDYTFNIESDDQETVKNEIKKELENPKAPVHLKMNLQKALQIFNTAPLAAFQLNNMINNMILSYSVKKNSNTDNYKTFDPSAPTLPSNTPQILPEQATTLPSHTTIPSLVSLDSSKPQSSRIVSARGIMTAATAAAATAGLCYYSYKNPDVVQKWLPNLSNAAGNWYNTCLNYLSQH